ncbi:hypothetical protein Gohar_006793 [Gossypium harknessii]|uniref:DUF4283 domain-containing protein n=1 Tax=Gossypium harknessii TaxID=34285 RepID=A0A7J9GEI3_9ROSI|nr:hypothetical protein [Gossypium harknessii]
MAKEKSNREAMYRVFKSLWFTKEEVNFVALNDGAIIVKFRSLEDRSRILNLMPWLLDNFLFAMMPFIKGKDINTYEFNMSLFWLRVYNIPLEYMDCQTALDFGNAIGELVAIDWKDRNGGWTKFLRLKIKINVSNPLHRIVKLVERDAIEIICLLKYERGGRRKPNALMEDFREVVDELSMVDLKTNNGWFTGVNNREGTTMVKERLDHFLKSSNGVASFLFFENKVICWSSSDHDAIVLDTKGRKPRDRIRDPRLNFRYDVCWAKEYEAKKIIKDAW